MKKTGVKMSAGDSRHFRSIGKHVKYHSEQITSEMGTVERNDWTGLDTSYWIEQVERIRFQIKEIEAVLSDMLPELEGK